MREGNSSLINNDMYILVKRDGSTVYPYSVHQLRRDNPNTSFQEHPNSEVLAYFGVLPVQSTKQPSFDSDTHELVEVDPELVDGEWHQRWTVPELPDWRKEEIQRHHQAQENERLLGQLRNTDWYVIRFVETGIPVPDNIAELRKVARSSIYKQ